MKQKKQPPAASIEDIIRAGIERAITDKAREVRDALNGCDAHVNRARVLHEQLGNELKMLESAIARARANR